MQVIDESRAEIWKYFSQSIAPLIRIGVSETEVECSLKNNFGGKYRYIVRKYGHTIRVSANLKSNGMMFFMAETKSGAEDYQFQHPSYEWRNIGS